MENNRLKYLLVVAFCILLMKAQVAFSNTTFSHNLLKMDVSKTSLGTLKVSLYTNKSYSDAVSVNKKSDYEYVILMPETANSMTAKPILKSVSDVVKNVEVKTQQYQGNVKGYTKIIVSTTKPIEITPQVHTLIQSQMSEKEYSELLAQAVKNKTVPAKNSASQKQDSAKTAQKSSAEKILDKKATRQAVAVVDKTAGKTEKAALRSKAQTKVPKTEQVARVAQLQDDLKKSAQKPVVKETAVEQAAPLVEKQSLAQAPQSSEVETSAPSVAPAAQSNIQPPQENTIQRFKKLIIANLYSILGLAAAFFIVLLIGARKMARNAERQKEIFTQHLDEKPFTPTDLSEKISDDMNWREKFETYKEATQGVSQQPSEEVEPSEEVSEVVSESELDDLFGAQESENNQYESVNTEEPEVEVHTPEFSTIEPSQDENLINTLFDGAEEEDETEETGTREQEAGKVENFSAFQPFSPSAEDDLIQSEFLIDDEKGFYLVDFEDKTALVGRIDEDIFVLKTFDEKFNAPIKARLNEVKGASVNYMTKVGNFKGIVEVTSDKMNLLIEL